MTTLHPATDPAPAFPPFPPGTSRETAATALLALTLTGTDDALTQARALAGALPLRDLGVLVTAVDDLRKVVTDARSERRFAALERGAP